jgi:hypothetical protein
MKKIIIISYFLVLPLVSFSNEKDFSWLLHNGLKNSNEFTWDKRSEDVFQQIVPDIKLKKSAEPSLQRLVRTDIMLPEPKKIINDRYVVFTGARPHDATTTGLLWIDVKEKTGAFAIKECPLKEKNDFNCITVGSKNYTAKNLPKEFVDVLKPWIHDYKNFPVFYVNDKTEVMPFSL